MKFQKRVDDVIMMIALAVALAGAALSLWRGIDAAVFLFGVAVLIAASMLLSWRERRRWKARQALRFVELEGVMGQYENLTQEAMQQADRSIKVLEQEIDEARGLIRHAMDKLSGSLTGLQSQSSDQRAMLHQLVEEMLHLASD